MPNNSQEIKLSIETVIRHPFVEKYIKQPYIDENKLVVLNYLFEDLTTSTELKNKYKITAMLIQIALDTHEKVHNHETANELEIKKQLSVLAGDFYSGTYYLILSEINAVDLIQELANAFKRVNELKMSLFNQDINSTEQFLLTIQQIDTIIFENTARFIGTNQAKLTYIKDVIYANRLLTDLQTHIAGEFTYIEQYVSNGLIQIPYETIQEFLIDELIIIKKRLNCSDNIMNQEMTMMVEKMFEAISFPAVGRMEQ